MTVYRDRRVVRQIARFANQIAEEVMARVGQMAFLPLGAASNVDHGALGARRHITDAHLFDALELTDFRLPFLARAATGARDDPIEPDECERVSCSIEAI